MYKRNIRTSAKNLAQDKKSIKIKKLFNKAQKIFLSKIIQILNNQFLERETIQTVKKIIKL